MVSRRLDSVAKLWLFVCLTVFMVTTIKVPCFERLCCTIGSPFEKLLITFYQIKHCSNCASRCCIHNRCMDASLWLLLRMENGVIGVEGVLPRVVVHAGTHQPEVGGQHRTKQEAEGQQGTSGKDLPESWPDAKF